MKSVSIVSLQTYLEPVLPEIRDLFDTPITNKSTQNEIKQNTIKI